MWRTNASSVVAFCAMTKFERGGCAVSHCNSYNGRECRQKVVQENACSYRFPLYGLQ
ncbi:hypothetical protein PaecuDRAFT_2812 [Paenibacillus curdlanolyticus YK9]|uniref:Uncharacterized protein n=1 Tax=Paenibacillus curdlanolyticus YK9 TaxID=717606 RepID=E0IB85_9BACL|nr:hypothetical protein PaecuDRAFT_2812 [Paenibacillus curdlanolyticus YK9]